MPELNDKAAWLREEINKHLYLAQHIRGVWWVSFGKFVPLYLLDLETFKSTIRYFPKILGYPVYCCVVGSWDNPKIFIYPNPLDEDGMRLRVEYGDGTGKEVKGLPSEKVWTDPA